MGTHLRIARFRQPLAFATIFLAASAVSPAYAYLDPGTGSMMLQLMLGGVAGLMVVGKLLSAARPGLLPQLQPPPHSGIASSHMTDTAEAKTPPRQASWHRIVPYVAPALVLLAVVVPFLRFNEYSLSCPRA